MESKTSGEKSAPMLAVEVVFSKRRPSVVMLFDLGWLADNSGEGVMYRKKSKQWAVRVMVYEAGEFQSSSDLIAALRGEDGKIKEGE